MEGESEDVQSLGLERSRVDRRWTVHPAGLINPRIRSLASTASFGSTSRYAARSFLMLWSVQPRSRCASSSVAIHEVPAQYHAAFSRGHLRATRRIASRMSVRMVLCLSFVRLLIMTKGNCSQGIQNSGVRIQNSLRIRLQQLANLHQHRP